MKQEELHYFEKVITKIKLFAMLFLVIIIAVTAALFTQQYFSIKKLENGIRENYSKIDSIIDEIGTVREENIILHNRLEYIETYLHHLPEKINAMNDDTEIELDDFDTDSVTKSIESGNYVSYPSEVSNILIMGTNQGLTDTIMIASINPKNDSISLVSIPRDLSVSGRKINELYYYYGPEKLMNELYDITGLEISNYVVVNMQSFVDIIDIVGGIDIYNEKAIVDYQYPTYNKGYMTYKLSAGEHHLSGSEALKFARSRKSTSDFDRAARQQQIVKEVFHKVRELGLTNLGELSDIYTSLSDNIDTNISLWQGVDYFTRYRSFSFETNNVLDTSELLYSTRNLKGQFVLLPVNNSYKDIQNKIFNIITY